MRRSKSLHRLAVFVLAGSLTLTGCAFQGVNSLSLPGAVGRDADGVMYYAEMPNVTSLESNSPVLIGNVVVGSIGKIRARDWHAVVEIWVKRDIAVPANAIAMLGQTSLLGSLHVSLDPPVGQSAQGRLQPGATIGLNRSGGYPSTEQTLSSLALVVNGGGLGQIGDVLHEFNLALNGHEDQLRDLLTRLNDFVGILDAQREDIDASLVALNRLASTLAGQRDVITKALQRIPPALDVLIRERPRITEALNQFHAFSATATGLITDTQDDLVHNLANLAPTLGALADVGPNLGTVLAYAPTFPYTQNFIDRGIRGDYLNLFETLDFTVPRLKRGLFLGTRWGQEGDPLVAAPGEPLYTTYTLDPLKTPLTAPQAAPPSPPLPSEESPPPPVAAPDATPPPNELPLPNEAAPPSEAPPPATAPTPQDTSSPPAPQSQGGA